MISKIDIGWNNSYDYDGVLYFLQRIVEMLDYSTIDIFRAPLLNTCSLIEEYLSISDGDSKPYHLEEVFHEFMWSFENDIVLAHKLGAERIQQIMNKLNKSVKDRKVILIYLQQSINRKYLGWTVDITNTIVSENKHKKRIEKVTRCLVPELLRAGYSRDEVYHCAKELLKSETNPSTALSSFLSRFDCEKREYSVYIGVSDKLIEFKSLLSKKIGLDFHDDGSFTRYEKLFDNKKGYQTAKLTGIKAIDSYKAATIATTSINLFSSFYQFFGDYSGKLISRKALVKSPDATEKVVSVGRDMFATFGEEDYPMIGELSGLIITCLLNNAHCSVPQIKKITDIHNQAISNNGLENGFLNLWSILEMICVTSPDDSKIERIISKTVPVLQNDFLSSYFHDINDNLKKVLNQDCYESLLKDISDGKNEDEKTACLILLPSYSNILDKTIDCLIDYPVLRTRILNLHDNCKTREDLIKISKQYAQRVSWHIYRLYRTRNQIIHSGRKPPHLKDLGEHLHSYVDCLVKKVIISLAIKPLCHVSNVFIDLEFEYETKNEYYQKAEPIDYESITKLFPSYQSEEVISSQSFSDIVC